MKSLKHTMPMLAVIALLAVKVSAGENANPFLGSLSSVASAELPAKAGELVATTDAKQLKQTTMDVVKAAIGLNPAAAPAIVGSIAQTTPSMAATAAGTALGLVPNQAVAIAKAAAAAAPTKAGAIVEAMCRVAPKSYQSIADAVAEIVPGAGKEILAGVIAAIPSLKDTINQTVAAYDGKIPSISAVLTQVAANQQSSGNPIAGSDPLPLPRGPSVGAPPVTPSGTPVVLDPGAGGSVPSGGPRGYAAP
jgi:hypothetical protein